MIANLIRYEAQIAATGRAKCRICGNCVEKGTYILKILGFRINQSLHPDCVVKITLNLRDILSQVTESDDREYILRAFDGVIKVGYYAKTEDPKKRRFTTLKVIKLAQSKQKEEPDVRSQS